MKLLNVSFGKLYTAALIFTLCFLLCFCITVPAMAGDDDCGFTSGAGTWVALNDPELLGPSHFHIKVPCPGGDPGSVYIGGLPGPGDWLIVTVEDVVIMHSDEMVSQPETDPPFPPPGTWWTLLGDTVTGPALWAYGRITSTNADWGPGEDWVLLGAYDSGPHGQNKDGCDYLIALTGIDEASAAELFDEIRSGVQWIPFAVFMDKGNVVVKMK